MTKKDVLCEIEKDLFSMQDIGYKEFHQGLMTNIGHDKVIGVRIPQLRKYAKEYAKNTEKTEQFLKALPHRYYEENNVHSFIISGMKDYDQVIQLLDKFLPYVDNWATCDGLSPKVFAKNKEKLLVKIKEWIKSDHEYTVRFAIEMLMTHFLDDDFEDVYNEMVAEVRSELYYINMMIAWYFATALAKQYERTIPFVEGKKLSVWCHNKTIQKAVESYRITEDQKNYLRTLRIKNR